MSADHPILADTRDGYFSVATTTFVMVTVLSLLMEFVLLGPAGLIDSSLLVVFAIPFALGASSVAIVRYVRVKYGPAGLVVASWTWWGTYIGMFVGFKLMKYLGVWGRWMIPATITMIVAGGIGFRLGLMKARAGDLEIKVPG
jgi:hypothetical protein